MNEIRLNSSGVSLEDPIDLENDMTSHLERAHSTGILAVGSKKSEDGSRKVRLSETATPISSSKVDINDSKFTKYATNSASTRSLLRGSSKSFHAWSEQPDDNILSHESKHGDFTISVKLNKFSESKNIPSPSPQVSEAKKMFIRSKENLHKKSSEKLNVSLETKNQTANDIYDDVRNSSADSKTSSRSRIVNESKPIYITPSSQPKPEVVTPVVIKSLKSQQSLNVLKSHPIEIAPRLRPPTPLNAASTSTSSSISNKSDNSIALTPKNIPSMKINEQNGQQTEIIINPSTKRSIDMQSSLPPLKKEGLPQLKLGESSYPTTPKTPPFLSTLPSNPNSVSTLQSKFEIASQYITLNTSNNNTVDNAMYSSRNKICYSINDDKSTTSSLRSTPSTASSALNKLFPSLSQEPVDMNNNYISTNQMEHESIAPASVSVSVKKNEKDIKYDTALSPIPTSRIPSSSTIKIKQSYFVSLRKVSKDEGKAFTIPKSMTPFSTNKENHSSNSTIKAIFDENEKTMNLNNPNNSSSKKDLPSKKSIRKSHRKSVNIAAINRPIERLEYLLGHGTGEKSENVQWYEADATSFYQPTPGEPISVAMNVSVLNLADIDTAKMSYRMKLEIWVAWPLTEAEVKSYYENPDDWKPYIHPEPVPSTITIERTEKMKFLSGRTTQLFLWRGKFVACECTLVTATYLEYMELVNFPFDCQHFHFKIGIRSDCDIPLKVVNDKVILTNLHAIGGFSSSDGRAMTQVNFDENACYFNVKSHMLTLKDFTLEGIECEIENTGDTNDTPFFHCALRMSRNYAFYVFRIFVPIFLIMVSSTLVFRFAALILDARLSYIVINMLTIVAFFFIISSILPLIPYLTFIDKYMNMALLYIVAVGVICVIFSEFSLENSRTEDVVFATCLVFLLISHILMGVFCMHIRRVEFFKTTINRHQVDEMENSRILNAWCTQEKVDKGEEFIVHTDLHPYDGDYNVYEGCERVNEIADSSVSKLGWLFDEVEDDDDYRKEIQESSYSVKMPAKSNANNNSLSSSSAVSQLNSISINHTLISPDKFDETNATDNNEKLQHKSKSKDYASSSSSSSAAALQNVFDSEGPVDFHQMPELEEGLSPINSNKIKSNTNRPNSKNGKKEFQRKSSLLAKILGSSESNVSGITDCSPRSTGSGSKSVKSAVSVKSLSSHGSKGKRKSVLKNFNFRERRRKSVNRGSIATEYLADDK